MPNHVTNILVVSGDAAKKQVMFEAIKNDEVGFGSFDFNKVIPMPENIFRGNLGAEEREKYGSNNWYDWSVVNWGTKWNSYGYHDFTEKGFDASTIEFQTAWNHPNLVIASLAKKYPDLSFELKWADEDFGYNVGRKEYDGGKEMFSSIPDGGSKEALELAAEIHATSIADEGYCYNDETGEYEYQNSDDE